jgi:5-formyltetrahydrofolate cyclo-ligase
MTKDIRKAKADIRARVRKSLMDMSAEQLHTASESAGSRLMSLEGFQHAADVMLYMPLANEVDVTPVAVRCFREAKTVCVPKVDWDHRDMDPVEVTSLDDDVLDCDEHGVRSPRDCRPILPSIIELVVVPGLAFDPQGNRLGRGGGYYDRFLAKLKPNVTTVGLVFDQQIVDSVPSTKHDRAVDIIVTDRRVTMAKAARCGK